MIYGILIGAVVLCVISFIRNEKVYRFVDKLLDEENDWWTTQINSGRPYTEFKRARSLNQTKMCLLFWRPLKSFIKPNLEDYYLD